MALATLSIDIEARLASFEKEMGRAARIAEKNAEEARAAWKRAGDGIASLGKDVVGLFAGYSLVEAFKGHIEFIDSLNDMQDATGAAIEKLSGLSDFAQRTGHSVDNATSLVVKLNSALNDVDPNSSASRAIAAIGLSADELRKMDPVDAIQSVAKALANYADDGAKARLVQELFGKSARELAPLLKDLADAGQLNAKFTAEQAEQADKFNKMLAEMQTHSANTARSIAIDLIPAIAQLLKMMNDGTETLSMLGIGDKHFADKALAPLAGRVNDLKFEQGVLMEQLRADYTNADTPRRRARLEEVKKELEQAKAIFRAADQTFNPPQRPRDENYSNEGRNAPKPSVGELPAKTKDAKEKKEQIDEAQRALAQYIETQQKELEQLSDLTETQKALNFLKSIGTVGEIPQVRELTLEQAKQVTIMKQNIALRKIDADLAKEQEAAQKALNDEIDRLSGRLGDEKKRALTARLELRLASGEEFSKEELDNIVRGIGGLEKPKQELSELDEFAKQAGRNIQDTLGQSMYATLSGQWGSLGDLWAQTVMKMVAEASAAQLGKLLLGDFAKTGDIGGLFGKGLNFLSGLFADGAAFGPGGKIHAFASGDVFNSPTMFGFGGGNLGVLGEAGPEAIMPLRRGPDGKLGIVSRGGGSRSTQITYAPVLQVDSRSDRAAVMSDTQQLLAQNNREFMRLLKAKGVVN